MIISFTGRDANSESEIQVTSASWRTTTRLLETRVSNDPVAVELIRRLTREIDVLEEIRANQLEEALAALRLATAALRTLRTERNRWCVDFFQWP